jgi:outer membrane biosynthesis protein TonB
LRPIVHGRVMPPNPEQASGYTQLEIHLDVNGVPESATVISSTVTPEMDARAREYVIRYWRWSMPTRNCAVYAVSTRVSVAWRPD